MSPPHRPREDGRAHPAEPSRSNLAAALALLSSSGAFQTLEKHLLTLPPSVELCNPAPSVLVPGGWVGRMHSCPHPSAQHTQGAVPPFNETSNCCVVTVPRSRHVFRESPRRSCWGWPVRSPPLSTKRPAELSPPLCPYPCPGDESRGRRAPAEPMLTLGSAAPCPLALPWPQLRASRLRCWTEVQSTPPIWSTVQPLGHHLLNPRVA